MEASTPTPPRVPGPDDAIRSLSKFWWLWLVFGIAWTLVALSILQFDEASVATVGVIIGIVFIATAFQQFVIAALVERGAWIFWVFGALLIVSGALALISPENTFAALADMLGFLFLVVGVFWVVQAFAERDANEIWWLGLTAGILMLVLAFWTSGQLFIEKQYTLLVFAGIWVLMQGATDIVRAFQLRKLGQR